MMGVIREAAEQDRSDPRCPICGQVTGWGERGRLTTCGASSCIDTLLHRRGQSHPTDDCRDCRAGLVP